MPDMNTPARPLHRLVRAAPLLALCGLAACGGGGSSSGDTPLNDTTAPTLNGLVVTQTAAGVATLVPSATDAVGVTGWCFKTSATKPAATDACFQAAAQQTVTLSPTSTATYIWARDAAGNVSEALTGPACSAAGWAAAAASTLPAVCMLTSLGEMVFTLESVKAPVTAANFLKYVRDGFYGGTVFHRVVSNFVVQGGGFTFASNTYTTKNAPYAAIKLEPPATTGLSNLTGTLAMARTSVLDSATSQFYVNVVDNPTLDTTGGGYAVFGTMVSGATTLAAIKAVPVVANGSELSLPTTPPVVLWAVQIR